MDGLIHVLNDYQIGNWCKRAAWIILALNFVHLLLQLYAIMRVAGSTPPLSFWMDGILPPLISFASGTLFSFFILYAAAVAVEHLTKSAHLEELEEEEEEMSQSMQK